MYESHITVEDINKNDFLAITRNIGVKPVIIEQDTGSQYSQQMMTAKFHKTQSLEIALHEMNLIAGNFNNVIRLKLEKIISKTQSIPPHLYLEFHLKYLIEENRISEFVSRVSKVGGHTSVNQLKQSYNNKVYRFATTRSQAIYDKLLTELTDFDIVNTIRECVVYDSNPKIDSGWVCNDCFFKRI